jgi:hypothetical protein
MERVLGAARDEGEPYADVVDIDVRPGLVGTASVVETTILRRRDEDSHRGISESGPRPRNRRRSDDNPLEH